MSQDAVAGQTGPTKEVAPEVFSSLVQQARADFGLRLFLFDPARQDVHYDPDSAFGAERPAVLEFMKGLNMTTPQGNIACGANEYVDPNGQYKLSTIFYDMREAPAIIGQDATATRNVAFIFDHELGHLASAAGMYKDRADSVNETAYVSGAIRGETIADVYASIRLIQRGNGTAEDIRLLAQKRIEDVIDNPEAIDHCSGFALLALAKELDKPGMADHIRSLSPDQSIKMAEDIAAAGATGMNPAFAKAQLQGYGTAAQKAETGEDALKAVAGDIMSSRFAGSALGNHKAGVAETVIKPYLDGTASKFMGKPVEKLDGAYWDKVRDTLSERKAQDSPVMPKIAQKIAPPPKM